MLSPCLRIQFYGRERAKSGRGDRRHHLIPGDRVLPLHGRKDLAGGFCRPPYHNSAVRLLDAPLQKGGHEPLQGGLGLGDEEQAAHGRVQAVGVHGLGQSPVFKAAACWLQKLAIFVHQRVCSRSMNSDASWFDYHSQIVVLPNNNHLFYPSPGPALLLTICLLSYDFNSITFFHDSLTSFSRLVIDKNLSLADEFTCLGLAGVATKDVDSLWKGERLRHRLGNIEFPQVLRVVRARDNVRIKT